VVQHQLDQCDPKVIKKLAQYPDLSADSVQRLYDRIDQIVDTSSTKQTLLRHPNCPVRVLSRALISAGMGGVSYMRAALDNPNCPDEIRAGIWDIVRASPTSLVTTLCARPDIPAELTRELMAQPKYGPRLEALASNPACPADMLCQLADEEVDRVRQAVASNPACPPDILGRLLRDSSNEVSREAANNPSLSRAARAMWQLARST
jgi:hypothetical protein